VVKPAWGEAEVRLDIRTEFKGVQRRLDSLQKDIREKVLVRAVNRTIEGARTDMSREIRSEFVISANDVRDQLRIVKAGFKAGVLIVEGSLIGGRRKGRSLNLIRFLETKVTLAENRKRKKGGDRELRFKIKRAGGKQVIPGAFIGNKGRTVFRRVGAGRLPIKPVRTIDVAQMFNTKRINAAVLKRIRERFPLLVEREAAFYVNRFNR
jgi:hypothetical protein